MLSGFQSPDAGQLLEPYVARFFEVIADLWRDWGTDMAQHFAEHGYPTSIITPDAIATAAEYLASTDLPAGLRRLLIEGRDDVARALSCRRRDAQPG